MEIRAWKIWRKFWSSGRIFVQQIHPDLIRWKLPEEFVHPSFTNVTLVGIELPSHVGKIVQKILRKNQRVSVRASRRTFSACLRTSCTFLEKIILPSSRKSIFKDKDIDLQTTSFNKNSSQYPQLPFCLNEDFYLLLKNSRNSRRKPDARIFVWRR